MLPPAGSGVRFSLLQPDPVWIWILFLLKKTLLVVCLTYIKQESNRIRIACFSLAADPERIWIQNLQKRIGSVLKKISWNDSSLNSSLAQYAGELWPVMTGVGDVTGR